MEKKPIKVCEHLETEVQKLKLFVLVRRKPKNFIQEKFAASYVDSYLLKFNAEYEVPKLKLFALVRRKPKNFIQEKFAASYVDSYLFKFNAS